MNFSLIKMMGLIKNLANLENLVRIVVQTNNVAFSKENATFCCYIYNLFSANKINEIRFLPPLNPPT